MAFTVADGDVRWLTKPQAFNSKRGWPQGSVVAVPDPNTPGGTLFFYASKDVAAGGPVPPAAPWQQTSAGTAPGPQGPQGPPGDGLHVIGPITS